ncbi:MAG: hypothetical protein K8R21_01200 [Leptospira sp.]|nr:hypothetical protein [Leptospira sp.]
MDISQFIIFLSIISIPGTISLIVLNHLTIYKIKEPFFFLFYSLLLGVINYSIFSTLYKVVIISHLFSIRVFDYKIDVWDIILNKNTKSLPYLEVCFTSLIALINGMIFSKLISNSIFLRIGNYLKITNKSGDDDIWFYFTNSKETNWVYLRDYISELTYFGAIIAYSEPFQDREIILKEVSVYRTKSPNNKLYDIPIIYLSLQKGQFSIEYAIT